MKSIGTVLILGVILRVFIAATTFHSDTQAFNLAGYVVSSGNILNLYDYLPNLADADPIKHIAVFNYPPAIYWFSGLFNFFFSNILNLKFLNEFLLDAPSNYANVFFNLHLLFLKIPYLIPDLLIGFILLKIFKAPRSYLAFALWMFNPINIFATYMMGQFDVIPTFFTILSIYLIYKNKLGYAALALGGGIAFKLYPVFLVIPLLMLSKNNIERMKLVFFALLPYLISIVPYLFSSNFRTTALFATQSSKSLYASILVSGGESILLFPTFLLFYYLIIWVKRISLAPWVLYTIPLLLFYIFTHFHSQWLLWLTPFLIIDLSKEKYRNTLPIILIMVSFFGSLLFFDPSLTVNIFAPLAPSLKGLPSIWTMLGANMDYNFSRSILQTILVASSLYLIYDYINKEA